MVEDIVPLFKVSQFWNNSPILSIKYNFSLESEKLMVSFLM
jgi:hypothetical protein